MTIHFDNDRVDFAAKVSASARLLAVIAGAIVALVSQFWLTKALTDWHGLSHATEAKVFYTLVVVALGFAAACGFFWMAISMTTRIVSLHFATRELVVKSFPLLAPNKEQRYPFSQFVSLTTRVDNSGEGGAYYIHSLLTADGNAIELPMIGSIDDAKKVEQLINERVLAG